MPSSIEILKPSEFAISVQTIQNFINDLQARLHSVDMVVKKQNNENLFLKKNMSKAVINLILISLARNKLDKDHLSKITGIKNAELNLFLKKLIEDGKIKEEGSIYTLP
jgi:DNA-binding TFAR19-related protein (PDSD5 family)